MEFYGKYTKCFFWHILTFLTNLKLEKKIFCSPRLRCMDCCPAFSFVMSECNKYLLIFLKGLRRIMSVTQLIQTHKHFLFSNLSQDPLSRELVEMLVSTTVQSELVSFPKMFSLQ